MILDTPSSTRPGALALAVGPALLLAAQLVQLSPTAHDTASELASLDAAPGRAMVSTVVGFVGVALTVAGLITLGRVVRSSRRRTAIAGTAMSYVGGLGLVALLGSSPLMISLAGSGGPLDLLVRVADDYESSWLSTVWVGLMLLGWTFGPLVLGVGLWRSGGSILVPALLVGGIVLMVLDAGRWPLAAGFAATWAGLGLASATLTAARSRPGAGSATASSALDLAPPVLDERR